MLFQSYIEVPDAVLDDVGQLEQDVLVFLLDLFGELNK